MSIDWTVEGVKVVGRDFPSMEALVGSLLDVVGTIVGGQPVAPETSKPIHMRDE